MCQNCVVRTANRRWREIKGSYIILSSSLAMFLFLVTCSLLRLKSCCFPFWQCTFYFLPSTLRFGLTAFDLLFRQLPRLDASFLRPIGNRRKQGFCALDSVFYVCVVRALCALVACWLDFLRQSARFPRRAAHSVPHRRIRNLVS